MNVLILRELRELFAQVQIPGGLTRPTKFCVGAVTLLAGEKLDFVGAAKFTGEVLRNGARSADTAPRLSLFARDDHPDRMVGFVRN